MDDAKRSVASAQQSVDNGAKAVASAITSSAAVVATSSAHAYNAFIDTIDHAQGYLDAGVQQYQSLEAAAVAGVKGVAAWSSQNPAAAYAGFGALALLSLPPTRHLLWRQTIGRFTRPEALVNSSRDKVETVKAQVTDYGSQIEKLEQRLALGQEELDRGTAKLRATRQELQRLAGVVARSEQVAAGVVQQLRLIKKVDASLTIRGEAAAQVAALRAARARINKGIYKVANQDI